MFKFFIGVLSINLLKANSLYFSHILKIILFILDGKKTKNIKTKTAIKKSFRLSAQYPEGKNRKVN
jgi:hypothetical protein